MPELPEVETVRRGLEPVLEGHVLAEVVQRREDLRWPLPERFGARLQGRRVLRLRRRSKWILLDLDHGPDGDETWMVHLGMSGRMLIEMQGFDSAADTPVVGDFAHSAGRHRKHDHIIVTTDQGARVIYNDARRFGAMDLWPTAELDNHPHLSTLGPEPLGNAFNADVLAAAFEGRNSPVKAALLDQKTVAGLGNIYVCEALFRSGIHPTRVAGSISAKRIADLTSEVIDTLSEAIEAGGSSLRDYRQADGELGYFQHSFKVYGREDEPCVTPSCKGTIRRIVQSGRSTFYCPKCQR
ncbi:MAG: bifunctional DNA-formamidopyrimidine glycosylase/DNA-(apurinic or apyrimidinic site) lyase [Pseudomonadota bacterium]